MSQQQQCTRVSSKNMNFPAENSKQKTGTSPSLTQKTHVTTPQGRTTRFTTSTVYNEWVVRVLGFFIHSRFGSLFRLLHQSGLRDLGRSFSNFLVSGLSFAPQVLLGLLQ